MTITNETVENLDSDGSVRSPKASLHCIPQILSRDFHHRVEQRPALTSTKAHISKLGSGARFQALGWITCGIVDNAW